MKKVYICSPLRDNPKKNIEKAKGFCKEEVQNGNLPIAPHIYFTQFMDDNNEEERTQALEFNKELIKFCDHVNVYLCAGYISKGMQFEIEFAKSIGKKIVYKRREQCKEEIQT